MKLLLTIAFLFAASGQPAGDAGEPFRLEAGDFRWIPLNVRHTPSEVDCHFEVVKGSPTVHIELLPIGEFRLFDRGREHDTLAITPEGTSGEFRRVVDTRGQYAVVIENAHGAPPAVVRLRVQTNLNPGSDLAQTLPPGRRLTVVLVSLGVFFATVAWAGRKLLSAARAEASTRA